MTNKNTTMTTAKIQAINETIDEWIQAVEKKKIKESSKNAVAAIKGSKQEKEIKKLCQTCDSYTNTLVSKLRAYESKLEGQKVK